MLPSMSLFNVFNKSVTSRAMAKVIPLAFLAGCGSNAPYKDIPYPVPIDPVEPFDSSSIPYPEPIKPFVAPIKQKPIYVFLGKKEVPEARKFDLLNSRDFRTTVKSDEKQYDPVVHFTGTGGTGNCGGTISEVFGYKIENDDYVVTTAAHCFDNKQDEYVWNEIFLIGTFLNAASKQVETYTIDVLRESALWIDPNYKNSAEDDIAFIRIPRSSVPINVKPAMFYPMDLDNYYGNMFALESAGYAGDKLGLSTHRNCPIINVGNNNGLITTCELYPGFSGGPTSFYRPDVLNNVGVNAFLSTCTNNSGVELPCAFHAVAGPEQLSDVPFLERKQACGVINQPTKLVQGLGSQSHLSSIGLGTGTKVNISYSFGDVADSIDLDIREHDWAYAEAYGANSLIPDAYGYIPRGSFAFVPCSN